MITKGTKVTTNVGGREVVALCTGIEESEPYYFNGKPKITIFVAMRFQGVIIPFWRHEGKVESDLDAGPGLEDLKAVEWAGLEAQLQLAQI